MKIINSLTFKIVLMGALTLILLIPLAMIKGQIHDRESLADKSLAEVSKSWAGEQTLGGPMIVLSYRTTIENKDGEKEIVHRTENIYPEKLDYNVDIKTQTLHRSIYDITVYNSSIGVEGLLRIPKIPESWTIEETNVVFNIGDVRGIDGEVVIKGKEGTPFYNNGKGVSFTKSSQESLSSGTIRQDVFYPGSTKETTWGRIQEEILSNSLSFDGSMEIPFTMDLSLRGSGKMKFQPYGDVTTVNVTSDCTRPSFEGDFLPSDRNIGDDGFTAKWSVSQLNRGTPDSTNFGVNLLVGTTQYQKAYRCTQYGILIILLVFVAGLLLELIWKKPINIIQYLVIGLSLVLFYALVLSFSEFISFGTAYLISGVMTVGALLGYFRGILRDRSAYALAGLVALAYAASFVLLQMENYALIAGTLLLFVVLVIIMYFTRNLNLEKE